MIAVERNDAPRALALVALLAEFATRLGATLSDSEIVGFVKQQIAVLINDTDWLSES